MPNIGFMELLLISIVALLVLGPEKLPQAVRTAALWIGRARRSFNKVRAEIEREIDADDIRRQLHNESIMADLDEAKEKASRLTRDTKESFSNLEKDVRHGLDGKTDGKKSGEESPETPRTESDVADSGDQDADDGKEQRPEETEQENKPVTDFYNNPPDKVITVQGRKFKAGKDDDDKA